MLTRGRGKKLGLSAFATPGAGGDYGAELCSLSSDIDAGWPNDPDTARSADVRLRRGIRAERHGTDDKVTAVSLSIRELGRCANTVWERRQSQPVRTAVRGARRAPGGRLSVTQYYWALFFFVLFLSMGNVTAVGVLKRYRPSFASLRRLLALLGGTVAPDLPLWTQWRMVIDMLYEAKLVGQALNILKRGENGNPPPPRRPAHHQAPASQLRPGSWQIAGGADFRKRHSSTDGGKNRGHIVSFDSLPSQKYPWA